MRMRGRAKGKAGHYRISHLTDLHGAAHHKHVDIQALIIPRTVDKGVFLIDIAVSMVFSFVNMRI